MHRLANVNKVTEALATGLYHEGFSSSYIAGYLSADLAEVVSLLSGLTRDKSTSALAVSQEAKRALKEQTGKKPLAKSQPGTDSSYGTLSLFRERRLEESVWVVSANSKPSGRRLCKKRQLKVCPTKGCTTLINENEECCQACYQLQLTGRPAVAPTTQYVGGDHFWN